MFFVPYSLEIQIIKNRTVWLKRAKFGLNQKQKKKKRKEVRRENNMSVFELFFLVNVWKVCQLEKEDGEKEMQMMMEFCIFEIKEMEAKCLILEEKKPRK